MASPRRLRSRFRGALLGGAVGDALAFPYQHYSRAFMRSLPRPLTREFATHHSGFFPAGQTSDDTQMMTAVVEAIIDETDITADAVVGRLLPLWRENLLVERDESSAEAMRRIVDGSAHWTESGLGPGRAEMAPLSRVVGLALWRHHDLDRLAEDVEAVTRITHTDPRVVACAAAAAAAIATNVESSQLVLGPFLDNVSRAAARFDAGLGEALLDLPRVLCMTEHRALRHVEAIRPDESYPPDDEGLGLYCVPALWTALYYTLKSPYRWERGVESCLVAGGHIDTPALLAGAMIGALVGEHGVPKALADALLDATQIRDTADRLLAARESAVDEASVEGKEAG
jgi:ADP-ribosylglycohydrolase